MQNAAKRKLLRQISIILISFVLVIVFNFVLPRILPGDPIANLIGIDREFISQERYEYYRHALGLDRNIFVQFGLYLKSLFNGTLGFSYQYNSNVSSLIGSRLLNTLQITIPAFIISSILSLSIGLFFAYRRNKVEDIAGTSLTIGLNAFPSFLIGIILLVVFAFILNWFPINGLSSRNPSSPFFDRIWHLILPVLTIVIATTPSKVLQVRNSAVSVMDDKYVLFARSNSYGYHTVAYKYIFANSFQPYLTIVGLNFAASFSGTIVVEKIFSINGMGSLMMKAITDLDYPTIQGVLFVTGSILLLSILVVDVLCYFFDPRVRRNDYV